MLKALGIDETTPSHVLQNSMHYCCQHPQARLWWSPLELVQFPHHHHSHSHQPTKPNTGTQFSPHPYHNRVCHREDHPHWHLCQHCLHVWHFADPTTLSMWSGLCPFCLLLVESWAAGPFLYPVSFFPSSPPLQQRSLPIVGNSFPTRPMWPQPHGIDTHYLRWLPCALNSSDHWIY